MDEVDEKAHAIPKTALREYFGYSKIAHKEHFTILKIAHRDHFDHQNFRER